MPNQTHLEMVNQGVEAWNKWREEHPELEPFVRRRFQQLEAE